MNPGWRVVDCINLEGALRYQRGQLVIHRSSPEGDAVIPMAQIAVVLVGIQVSVSGAVIAKLSEYDISLLVCDWRSVPVAGAVPWREHTRIGIRHRAQAELSLPRKKQAWSRIVSSKINGQANTLQAVTDVQSEELKSLAGRVKSGDPDNYEARAARVYWPQVSGTQAFSRRPGAREVGWNSALDYGYTLLRGYGIRAIAGAGLAGALGVFHRGRGNAFALVDDLMEPFRPMVDQIVFTHIFPDDDLTPAVKQVLSNNLGAAFGADGKSMSTVFNEFAQHYGRYVETEEAVLKVPTWKGKFNAGQGQ